MLLYTSLVATEVVCVAKYISEIQQKGAHFHFGSLVAEMSESLEWDLGSKFGTVTVTKYAIAGTGYRAINIRSKIDGKRIGTGFISTQGYGDIEFEYGQGDFAKGYCVIYTTTNSELEEGASNPKLF